MLTVIVKSPEMAENERRIKEKENQIKEMEIKQKLEKHIEEDTKRLCEYFNSLIDKTINRGKNFEVVTLYTNYVNTYWCFWKSYKKAKQIFEEIGYKVHTSSYSDSWTRRSGKVATLTIEWE